MLRTDALAAQRVRQFLQAAKMSVAQACHVLDVVYSGEVEFERFEESLFVVGEFLCGEEFEQVAVVISGVEGDPTYAVVED